MSTAIVEHPANGHSLNHESTVEVAVEHTHTNLDKKSKMSTELERVQKVIHRFKEVVIELSSMVSADERVFRTEELQSLSEQMCIALNELTHMIESTDEVFSADEFMIIAREMKKQKDVRGKVLVILLRSHRVLLETITKSITTETLYSEPACVKIEGAVSQMEAILPRGTVKVPTMWGSVFGEK